MSSRAFDGVFRDTTVQSIRWNEAMKATERGSFNHLVDMNFGMRWGQIAKTMDRRRCQILVINTPIGNVILFKRFRGGREVIYAEFPRELRLLFGGIVHGEQTESVIEELLGYHGRDNIGQRVYKFLKFSLPKLPFGQAAIWAGPAVNKAS